MGQREMFLLIGALFFFSMTTLSVNRFNTINNEVMMKNEFDYYGISLAQRIIEEAKTRAFDVYLTTTSNPVNIPSNFTSSGGLGRLYNEYYPYFNDVDDYHNLTLNVNTTRANYTVTCQVYYVTENSPNVKVTYNTFYKKLTVTVSCNYMTTSVSLSQVFSYYELG